MKIHPLLLSLSAGAGRGAALVLPLLLALVAYVHLAAPGPAQPLSASGAQASPGLAIVGTVPLPGEPLQSQVILFFNADITLPAWPAETDRPPLTFDPPIPGEFRVGPNYIAFRATEVPEQTVFQAELHPALRAKDGRELPAAARRHVFANFLFQPSRLWVIDEKDAGQPVLGILFPAEVERSSLAEHLSVRSAKGGAPVPFRLETAETRHVFRLTLENPPPELIEIRVAAGLSDSRGLMRLLQDKTFSYPTEPALEVKSVRWADVTAEQQEFVLSFSADVDPAELARFVSVIDMVRGERIPCRVTTSETGQEHLVAVSVADPAEILVNVSVAAGLAAVNHSSLPGAHSAQLRFSLAPLQVRSGWWSDDEDGKMQYIFCLNQELAPDVDAGAHLAAHLKLTPEVPGLSVSGWGGDYFYLTGEWRSNTHYVMEITPGLMLRNLFPLERAVTHHMVSEKPSPYWQFTQPGKCYFPRSGNAPLELTMRNVDKISLSVSRLFPSNIAVAVREMEGDSTHEGFPESWGEQIATVELAGPKAADSFVAQPLDLASLLPAGRRGVFCLQARRADSWRVRSKIVLSTNIGILAHWQEDHLVLFAHDLASLDPLADARVRVYSTKNQLLGEGATDAQGLARLTGFARALGAPSVAVVESADDYSFLELEPREDEATGIDPGLAPYDRRGYDAFLYADRDLYRPGEPVHLRWIVRTHYGDAAGAIPLRLALAKPNGQDLITQVVLLSELGTGELTIATRKDYPTGSYRAALFVPESDTPIGSIQLKLEEFVPDRMTVDVEIPTTPWLPEQQVPIKLRAAHLFGAPAADRRCEVKVDLQRTDWHPEGLEGFHFGNDDPFQTLLFSCGEAQTDEEGTAEFVFDQPLPPGLSAPLRARAVGVVYELGGRMVRNFRSATLFPSELCLGLAIASGAAAGSVEVSAAAVRPDGAPADLGSVEVVLERQIWNYHVRRYYGYYEPNWTQAFETLETREVALDGGRGSALITVPGSGYYRVRVRAAATPQSSTLSFYSWGGRCDVVRDSRPSLIKVSTDKEAYEVGERARVRVESPFDGAGIVVVQAEEIQRIVPLRIVSGVGEIELELGPDQVPGVWIEATVVHSVLERAHPIHPFSSFAVAGVRVLDPSRRLEVGLPGLAAELRPQTAPEIDVEVRDHAGQPVAAELTLAAVDEGIHQLSGYRNPDPFDWLGRLRRPDHRLAHYYDKVAYQPDRPGEGGDGIGYEMSRRLDISEDTWIRSVALWSGTVRTGDDGKARIAMDLPEFNGQLRLVAVACTARASGSQAASVFVRRPYMLRTSLPRFLLPGDSCEARAILFNTTGAPVTARVQWSAAGALVAAAGAHEVALPPRGEVSLAVPLAAGTVAGGGELQWRAAILGADGRQLEELAETDPIPVKHPAVFQSHHELIVLAPGEERTLRNSRFLEDERAELEISVSANPLTRLQAALEYVVGYPYGCVEQTVSRLMPLYLLRRHAELIGSSLPEEEPLDGYIQAGIERLFTMQTSEGGLAFWPGSDAAYPYGSVYAMHFLMMVKADRQFPLPERSLADLRKYVSAIAKGRGDGLAPDLLLRAYAIYTLALDGDAAAIDQIARFDAIAMPAPARFLLAAALARNTGDRDRVQLYLSSAPAAPYMVTGADPTLGSDIRNAAIELLALEQMDGDLAARAERADRLAAFLESNQHGTTQESAFVISALTAYLSRVAAGMDSAAATVTGISGPIELRGARVYRRTYRGPGGLFVVNNHGGVPLYVNLTTRGVPAQPNLAPVQEGISVARDIYHSSGTGVADTLFEQSQVYVVGLTLNTWREVSNVIVADLLPAGFELENPRLDADAVPAAGFTGAATPARLEVRDDRLILAFDTLSKGTYKFYYVVRAVTPGQYQHPAVEAECMYDASVHGASAPAAVTVRPRRK